jgi:hypothetical protein
MQIPKPPPSFAIGPGTTAVLPISCNCTAYIRPATI